MYRIESDNFNLEMDPGDLQGDRLYVKVSSFGFGAAAYMEVDAVDFADFAVQLKRLYEKLEGSLRLEELYSPNFYLQFDAVAGGHINIKGSIVREGCEFEQKLIFENDVDQTELKDFAAILYSDYGQYAES